MRFIRVERRRTALSGKKGTESKGERERERGKKMIKGVKDRAARGRKGRRGSREAAGAEEKEKKRSCIEL